MRNIIGFAVLLRRDLELALAASRQYGLYLSGPFEPDAWHLEKRLQVIAFQKRETALWLANIVLWLGFSPETSRTKPCARETLNEFLFGRYRDALDAVERFRQRHKHARALREPAIADMLEMILETEKEHLETIKDELAIRLLLSAPAGPNENTVYTSAANMS